MDHLIFTPINFENHASLCVKFRADSFLESFGTTEPFFEVDTDGVQYIEWLKGRIGATYNGLHIWYQGNIIGQLELGRRKIEDNFGYVNLYYLIPEVRGKGFSSNLDEFATSYLKGLGYRKARLSVSPTNKRAIRFYLKNGWNDLGITSDVSQIGKGLKFPVIYMEKIFD